MLLLLREARRHAEGTPEGPQLGRFSVLACLVGLGSLSQADVARRVGFDPSDLVTVIDALEHDGLVERRRDPADRRRYALTATPAGVRWFAERSDKGAARARAFFAALDDEEYAVLQEL